jgi:outer membrane usher protein
VRYSVATGNYRNFTTTQNTTVLQAYVRYGLNEFWSPGVEVLMSSNYRNLGLQASFNSALGSLSFNTLFSNLSIDNTTYSGFAQNLNYAAPAMGNVSAVAGLGMQSVKYTTPSSGLNLVSNALFTNDSFKYNAYVGLNLKVPSFGGVSLSVNQQRNWKNEGSQQVRLGFGTNIDKVNVGISLDQTSYTNNTPTVNGVSVSASIPLNFGVSSSGGLRAGYNQRDNTEPSQTLSYYGGDRDTQLNYSLSQTKTASLTNSSASASWSHNYGNLGASYSASSRGDEQYGLSASGAVVLHSGGVLLAPYLGETFGIVEVPKGEGVSLVGSTTRVNSSGYGVVSNLSPYYMNEVQISLEGASSELEVESPTQRVAPVEGSIVRLKFNTSTGRPLLIVLQPNSGKTVPIGASVSDEQGLELGTVGQGSRALVRVKKPKDRLKVVWGDKPNETCFVEYNIDEKNKASAAGFTNLKLPCVSDILALKNN